MLEAAGSILGSILVTYMGVTRYHSFTIAGMLMLVVLFFSCIAVLALSKKAGSKIVIAVLFIGSVLLFSTGQFKSLQSESLQRQWPNYTLLEYKNSHFNNIVITEQSGQINILVNGKTIAYYPAPDWFIIEELAHIPLLAHTKPEHILLIGNGIGGILSEILKHPVTRIDYLELDPLLPGIIKQSIPTDVSDALGDPRVNIYRTDGRLFLDGVRRSYDVIILNLPEPTTLEINRFYSTTFFRICRKALKPGGLVCTTMPASAIHMNQAMTKLNCSLIHSVSEVFTYHQVIPDENALILMSGNFTLPALTADTLAARLQRRRIMTRVISLPYLTLKFADRNREYYNNKVAGYTAVNDNRDFYPVAVFYSLMLWTAMHQPEFEKFFELGEKISVQHVIIIILLIGLILFMFQRISSRAVKSVLLVPILTTGWAGMSMTVVFALIFQAVFGYLYYWIGVLIASFMAGLALGSFIFNLNLDTQIKKQFLILEAGFSVLLLLFVIPILLGWHSINPVITKFGLILFALASGVFVGGEFPIAGAAYASLGSNQTRTASIIYSTDLIGACLGASLTSVWLIPVLGMANTILAILLLKLVSLTMIIFNYNRSSIKFVD